MTFTMIGWRRKRGPGRRGRDVGAGRKEVIILAGWLGNDAQY